MPFFVLFGSCATMQKADDVLVWVQEKQKIVDEKFNAFDKKLEDIKKAQDERVAKYESVIGAFDENGDGKVTTIEAADAIKRTTIGAITDPEKRKLLTDPEFWTAIALSVAGVYTGKKAALKGVAMLHQAGRSLVDGNGNGNGTPS